MNMQVTINGQTYEFSKSFLSQMNNIVLLASIISDPDEKKKLFDTAGLSISDINQKRVGFTSDNKKKCECSKQADKELIEYMRESQEVKSLILDIVKCKLVNMASESKEFSDYIQTYIDSQKSNRLVKTPKYNIKSDSVKQWPDTLLSPLNKLKKRGRPPKVNLKAVCEVAQDISAIHGPEKASQIVSQMTDLNTVPATENI